MESVVFILLLLIILVLLVSLTILNLEYEKSNNEILFLEEKLDAANKKWKDEHFKIIRIKYVLKNSKSKVVEGLKLEINEVLDNKKELSSSDQTSR